MTISPQLVERLDKSDEGFHEIITLDNLSRDVRRRRYRDFCDKWVAILSAVRTRNVQMLTREEYEYFNEALALWFKVLASPSFQFEDGDEYLFTLNSVVTNMLAITPHRNGDKCIEQILSQDENLAKLLLLYTPRSNYEFPIARFFELNPMTTSLWYSSVWNWVDTYVSPRVYEKCRTFIDAANPLFEPFDADLICGYFRCTYVDSERDREVKRVFMNGIRRFTSQAPIVNRPNPRSIAVVSAYWTKGHAVYRAFSPYIEKLAEHYDLTLVHLYLDMVGRKEPVTDHFKQVKKVLADTTAIGLTEVADNDFQLAYYPDVGMSQESLYLSSIRLAPIQCMGTGHPVSSTSPVMDYFISGAEVETQAHPENNYDERLALLPGLSVQPVKPEYKPEFPAPGGDFIINCPWMHMKNNLPVARILRRILDKASRPVKFAIYPGCYFTCNMSHMATMQDYSEVLPLESFTIHKAMSYVNYMRTLENGRFAMHSYPFGGGTTAVDALIMGQPLIVRRGTHEYNRFSAALLERLGLRELIAESDDEWVDVAVRLVDDSSHLADVSRRIREADLDRLIFRLEDADMLRRAFSHLIKNHETIQKSPSRDPVRIE